MFDAKGYETGPCDLSAPQMPWHGLVELNLSIYAWTVLTDNGSVSHTLATPAGLSSFPPRMVWNFEKAGLPAVPALTVDEDAAGMELRQDVLAPLAPSWQQGAHLHPLEDAGGNVWLVTGIVSTINSDRSGSFVLSLYPQDALEVGGEMAPLKTVTTTYLAGELPSGITATGTYTLRGIKDQGRKWLYTLSGDTLQGVAGMLNGVIELTIAGTGSYSGGSVTGLSVSMAVLKTTAECAWQNTTVTDTATVKEFHQSRIALAFYDSGGDLHYPTFEVSQYWRQETTGCAASNSGSESGEYVATGWLSLDGSDSGSIVYREDYANSWTGDEDPPYAGSGSGTVEYSFDGALVSTWSNTRSLDNDGCIFMMSGVRGAAFLTDPWPTFFTRQFSETWEDGVLVSSSTETRYGCGFNPMDPAANILSLVGGVIGAQAAGWTNVCDGAGSPGITSGRIVAYASPKGLHAGGALGPTTKGSFSCSAGTWGITLAYPRFAAYDPRQDRVALLKDNPVAYV